MLELVLGNGLLIGGNPAGFLSIHGVHVSGKCIRQWGHIGYRQRFEYGRWNRWVSVDEDVGWAWADHNNLTQSISISISVDTLRTSSFWRRALKVSPWSPTGSGSSFCWHRFVLCSCCGARWFNRGWAAGRMSRPMNETKRNRRNWSEKWSVNRSSDEIRWENNVVNIWL